MTRKTDATLHIKLFGSFSLDWKGKHIDDSDNRSRKSWILLAYLFCHRDRVVSRDELIRAVWEDSDKNTNPQSAIKTLMHRVRSMLNSLGDNAGYDIILADGSGYRINPSLPMEIDTELFSTLLDQCSLQDITSQEKLNYSLQSLDVFTGEFLPKLSTEQWVIPLSIYYHDRFLSAAHSAAEKLYSQDRFEECLSVCRKGLAIESYHEPLNLLLMKTLESLGDKESLIAAYDKLNSLLYNNFGTVPSEEITELYQRARSSMNASFIPADMLFEHLREDNPRKGAIVCDYELLVRFYQIEARQIMRSGDVCHIAMFTISAPFNGELTRRIRDNAMNNLQEILRSSLRSGDMVARCSPTQFVVLLPQANYENSCMVCDRIYRAFFRQYPHAAVEITAKVQPLQPTVM